jgi:hypothetical protein
LLVKWKTIADLLGRIYIFIGGRQHQHSVSRNEWIVKREPFTDAIPPAKKMKRLIFAHSLNWPLFIQLRLMK